MEKISLDKNNINNNYKKLAKNLVKEEEITSFKDFIVKKLIKENSQLKEELKALIKVIDNTMENRSTIDTSKIAMTTSLLNNLLSENNNTENKYDDIVNDISKYNIIKLRARTILYSLNLDKSYITKELVIQIENVLINGGMTEITHLSIEEEIKILKDNKNTEEIGKKLEDIFKQRTEKKKYIKLLLNQDSGIKITSTLNKLYSFKNTSNNKYGNDSNLIELIYLESSNQLKSTSYKFDNKSGIYEENSDYQFKLLNNDEWGEVNSSNIIYKLIDNNKTINTDQGSNYKILEEIELSNENSKNTTIPFQLQNIVFSSGAKKYKIAQKNEKEIYKINTKPIENNSSSLLDFMINSSIFKTKR